MSSLESFDELNINDIIRHHSSDPEKPSMVVVRLGDRVYACPVFELKYPEEWEKVVSNPRPEAAGLLGDSW